MTCRTCSRDLPEWRFHLDGAIPGGRKLDCRDCRNEARRKRYASCELYRAQRLEQNRRSRGAA